MLPTWLKRPTLPAWLEKPLGELARRARWLWALAVLVFFVIVASAAHRHAERYNTQWAASDQGAFLSLVEKVRAGRFADGSRGPGYAFLLLGVSRADLDRDVIFARAKPLNIAITALVWVGLWFALRRFLTRGQAFACWAVIGATCLMQYAPYVKAEGPFFGVLALVFLLLLRLLDEPRVPLALAAGALLGYAYLLKSPALTLCIAFGLAATLKIAWEFLRAPGSLRSRAVRARPGVVSLALVLLAAALVAAPLLIQNQRKFGRAFYNVNTTFYIWYDSWKEAQRGTRAHGDRTSWPDLPPDKLPSASRYFETHDAAHAFSRLERGAKKSFDDMGRRGALRYALAYAVACLLLGLALPRRALATLLTNWPSVAFASAYLAAQLLSSAWYEPIAVGPRVMMAGYPIWIAAFAIAIARLSPPEPSGARRLAWSSLVALVIGLWLFVDLASLLAGDFAVARGGR